MMKLIKDNKNENFELKQSKYALWKANTKFAYHNSSFHQYIDSHRKVIAFSIMSILSLSLLILGSVLTGLHAPAIGSMIIGGENGIVSTPGVYGIFGLISGLFGAIFTFIYSFTVFKQQNQQLNC